MESDQRNLDKVYGYRRAGSLVMQRAISRERCNAF